MSIIKKYTKVTADEGVFVIVKGERSSGKTTLAGTLPGKSILIQASIYETGSTSAKRKAKELGNDLTVCEFDSLEVLTQLLDEAAESEFDNIYIDGISAITEIKFREPRVSRKINGGGTMVWDGFREIADTTEAFIQKCKKIAETKNKNVFLTAAIKLEYTQSGEPKDPIIVVKGNATIASLEGYGNNMVVATFKELDNGDIERQLLIKNQGPHKARIDSLLDSENPSVIESNAKTLIDLIKGE